MTKDELAALPDAKLKRHFEQSARYYREMPGGACYCIRSPISGMALCDKDTMSLWDTFKSEVESYRKANKIVQIDTAAKRPLRKAPKI